MGMRRNGRAQKQAVKEGADLLMFGGERKSRDQVDLRPNRGGEGWREQTQKHAIERAVRTACPM